MALFYDRNGVTIYCGDNRPCLSEMPAESIDLIVTSPPYNCRKPYDITNDEQSWSQYYEWMDVLIRQFYRLLRHGGTLALNVPGVVRWQANHLYASTWCDYDPFYASHRNGERTLGKGRIEPVGFRLLTLMEKQDSHLREPIIWVKGTEGNAICSDYRMGCDSDPYLRPAHEMILLGSKSQWFHRGGTGRRGAEAVPFLEETKDVWFIPPTGSSEHPAPFPEEIPSRLIRLFTHAEDSVILDPFCGIGTTLSAASKLGRRSIGIDISPLYCQRAAERVAQGVLPLDIRR